MGIFGLLKKFSDAFFDGLKKNITKKALEKSTQKENRVKNK